MAGKTVNRKTDIVAFWILNVALILKIIGVIVIDLAYALKGYEIIKDFVRQIIGILPWVILLFHMHFHSRMKKDILLVVVFVIEIYTYVIDIISQVSVLGEISAFFERSIWLDFSISGRYYLWIARDCLMVLMCCIILINIFVKSNEKVGAQIPFYVLAIDKLIFVCLMFVAFVGSIITEEVLWINGNSGNLLVMMSSLFFYIANIIHIAGRRREKLRTIEAKELSSEERLIFIKNQYEKGLINEQEYQNKKAEVINLL